MEPEQKLFQLSKASGIYPEFLAIFFHMRLEQRCGWPVFVRFRVHPFSDSPLLVPRRKYSRIHLNSVETSLPATNSTDLSCFPSTHPHFPSHILLSSRIREIWIFLLISLISHTPYFPYLEPFKFFLPSVPPSSELLQVHSTYLKPTGKLFFGCFYDFFGSGMFGTGPGCF